MAIACFWIPANRPWDAQDELNRFLDSHRVLAGRSKALGEPYGLGGWT